jgi:type III secretion regulatory protein HpaA
MTRVAQRFTLTAQQAAAYKSPAKSPSSKSIGQFATLYCGAQFAHGGLPDQQNAAPAKRAKEMAARLARWNRNARGKRCVGITDGADNTDPVADQPDFDVTGDVRERHGGHGGGRGGQDDDQNEVDPCTVSFKGGRARPPRLSIAVPLPAPDPGADPYALREACSRELLALQSGQALQPGAGVTAQVHAWSVRWLGVQQIGVTLPEAGLEQLRAHPSPQRSAAPLSERARDVNLLTGLLLRQFDRPRTPRQCQDALDTLRALLRSHYAAALT